MNAYWKCQLPFWFTGRNFTKALCCSLYLSTLEASPPSYNKLEDENTIQWCELVTVKFSSVGTNWEKVAEPVRSAVGWVPSLCVSFGTWPSTVGLPSKLQALCSNLLFFIYPLKVAGTKIKTYMASVYVLSLMCCCLLSGNSYLL